MSNDYVGITPMLGARVLHKKTGKPYSVATRTTTINGKPVVWLSGERGRSKSGYKAIEQVIRDYELEKPARRTSK